MDAHVATGGDAVGHVLAGLAVMLTAGYVGARVARRIRQPAVVGEIVGGIVLGPSVLGLLPGDVPSILFPPSTRPYLEVIAQLGLALFMFGVGYRFDPSHVRGAGRQVGLVSAASVLLPFVLGCGLALLLPRLLPATAPDAGGAAPALFLGTAMAITAFPVLARIVAEYLPGTRLGAVALASAAVQDVVAWCLLAVVVAVATSSGTGSVLSVIAASAAVAGVLVLAVRPLLARLLAGGRAGGDATCVHVVLVVGLLASAWVSHEIGLHVVFGAFLFGVVVPREEVEAVADEVPRRIEHASMILLPVFFTVTGLSVDLTELGGQGVLLVVAVVVVACVGKFVGATGAALATGSPPREAALLGVLLNTRGLTELIILDVGLDLGVLDGRLFTAMVVMAVVTTVATGPVLAWLQGAERRDGRCHAGSAGGDAHAPRVPVARGEVAGDP